MLGEMKVDPRSKPKRILERREDILDALFERTFARLSHDARHIFLLLATWRSLVPIPALDVVVNGREQGSVVDTDEAVAELESLSLIQVVSVDDEAWLDIPLPAWLFGRRKLITDPERIDVERESELLQLFGPSMSTDLDHGLVRPTRRFWEAIRDRVEDRGWLEKWEPWLDRLGRQVPELWIWIADELEDRGRRSEAERFLRRAVEDDPSDPNLWLRLAQHYESRDDDRAALQAWVARAVVPAARFDDVSFAANKVNGWLRRSRVELTPDERRLLVQPLISTMEARSDEADAQDFSRLAWLYVNTGDRRRGIDAARRGLDLDPDQSDCRKFISKFEEGRTRATRR
jgi:tetratricopeptide (TPR) repeat protein